MSLTNTFNFIFCPWQRQFSLWPRVACYFSTIIVTSSGRNCNLPRAEKVSGSAPRVTVGVRGRELFYHSMGVVTVVEL